MATSAATGIIGLPDVAGTAGKYLKSDGSQVAFDALDVSTSDISGAPAGLLKGSGGVIAAAVSGTDIKTINGNSLLGSGNIVVTPNVVVTGVPVTAVSNDLIVATAAITVTLPATPSVKDTVHVSNYSAGNVTVARNGSNIIALNEDLTHDISKATLTFIYVDATRGWIIL